MQVYSLKNILESS